MCTQYKQSDTVSTLHTVRQSLTLSLSLSTHHHNPPTNCSLTLPTTTRLGFAYKFVYLLFSRIKTVPERLQLRTWQYRSRRRRGEGRKDETTNARTTVHDADGASRVCLGGGWQTFIPTVPSTHTFLRSTLYLRRKEDSTETAEWKDSGDSLVRCSREGEARVLITAVMTLLSP